MSVNDVFFDLSLMLDFILAPLAAHSAPISTFLSSFQRTTMKLLVLIRAPFPVSFS